VLQDKRERCLALVVSLAAFADSAGRGIQKKRAVVGLTIVVTGGAKTQWARKNQKRGRKLPPMMPGVNQRGVERRKIRTPLKEPTFKSAQGGIDPKSAQQNDHRKNFQPPQIATLRLAELREFGLHRRRAHFVAQILWR